MYLYISIQKYIWKFCNTRNFDKFEGRHGGVAQDCKRDGIVVDSH